MKNNWKKFVKFFFVYGSGVLSLFAGGWIIIDLFIKGYDVPESRTFIYIGFALIFLFFAMSFFAYDFYKVKK